MDKFCKVTFSITKMMPPLVSVCIPSYNHSYFVRETILSIIDQSYDNIELIVVDDGSDDNTFEQILLLEKRCKERFKRFVAIENNHLGRCATLNKLVSLVQGSYVYFIASDDIAQSNACELFVEFLSKNSNYVLAVGDNQLINSASKRIGWDLDRNPVQLEKAQFKTFVDYLQYRRKDVNFLSEVFGSYSSLVHGNYVPNGYMVTIKALRCISPFTNKAPLEDWYMMLQLAKVGKFKFFDEILFSYRWHANNTIKNQSYIHNISRQTLQFEYNLVLNNRKWSKIFLEETHIIKTKISLGGLFVFYKEYSVFGYQYVFKFFNFKFVIHKVNYT